MTATAYELLDLIARWIHVIAGIMWVGNSMLFNWLDRSLRPATGATQTPKPTGTIWLLHSGGFYYVEKTLLDGAALPRPLHWFKWQAYTTWLSGAALLIVVYYAGNRAVLADPTVDAITHGRAGALGIGAIAGGWALYEIAQRLIAPAAPRAALCVWLVGLTGIGIALTQLLAGRAAFLHVGAMLATIMAGNVALTIVPSQRALVASIGDPTRAAEAAALSARAKRVSIHNNYFTFPVIALMVSNHFSAIYGHHLRALLLIAIVVSGAAVRHVLNVRFTWPAWRRALAATLVAGVAAIYALLAVPAPVVATRNAIAGGPGPTFTDVRRVIDRRCAACHSAEPSDLTFGAAPAGVAFDTPEQIVARAARIHERAVVTRTMPPANRTHITDAERAMIGRWIEGGAAVRP